MKKIIFLISALAFSHFIAAQTEKGNFLVGGSARYFVSMYDGGKSKTVNISPNIGYFFAKDWLLGVHFPLNYRWANNETNKFQGTNFSAGIFARRYFLPNRFKWFAQVEYTQNWQIDKAQRLNLESDRRSSAWNVGLGVGATYFLSQSIGIEALLKYNRKQEDTQLWLPKSNLGLDIGLQIYLGRKKEESESAASFAMPTAKGNIALGGSASLDLNNIANNLSIYPQIGYFVRNNFLIGGKLGADMIWRGENAPMFSYRNSRLNMGVFTRYYFLPHRFKMFVEAGMSYTWLWYQSSIPQQRDSRGTVWNWNVALGATYFISPSVGLEASWNVQRMKSQTIFPLNRPIDFTLGLQIYFNRK